MNMFGKTRAPKYAPASASSSPGSVGTDRWPPSASRRARRQRHAAVMRPSSKTSPFLYAGTTATSSGCTVGQCRHSL